MSLRASITPDRTSAYAGIPVFATVTVANTADLVDAFEIRVLGVDRSWVQTSPQRLQLLHRLRLLRLRFHRVAAAVMTVVAAAVVVITAVAVMTQHPRRQQQQQLLAQLLQHQQCHHQLFRNLWCPRHLLDRARRYP